jgi:hypothetical protein
VSWRAAINFDFFDDQILAKSGRVEKGLLKLGSNQYKIVNSSPNVEQIPTETLMSLVEFARTGGLLIASRRIPATKFPDSRPELPNNGESTKYASASLREVLKMGHLSQR